MRLFSAEDRWHMALSDRVSDAEMRVKTVAGPLCGPMYLPTPAKAVPRRGTLVEFCQMRGGFVSICVSRNVVRDRNKVACAVKDQDAVSSSFDLVGLGGPYVKHRVASLSHNPYAPLSKSLLQRRISIASILFE